MLKWVKRFKLRGVRATPNPSTIGVRPSCAIPIPQPRDEKEDDNQQAL